MSIAATRSVGKLGTAKACGGFRNSLRTNYLILARARTLFPQKTALPLSEITGYPVRTCEYWLSKSTLPSEALAGEFHRPTVDQIGRQGGGFGRGRGPVAAKA